MLVEKVKHTFENNSHFMDLTLVDGDEFASYSSSSYSSGNTNNKDEKKNGPAQSITKKIQVKSSCYIYCILSREQCNGRRKNRLQWKAT